MSLNIEQGTVGTTAAVRMTGVVDWSTLAQFRRALLALVSGPDLKVRLDVAGVVFRSPEARLVLRRCMTRARQRGGDFVVEGFSAPPNSESPAALPAQASEVGHRHGAEGRSRACHPAAAVGRLTLVRPATGSRRASDVDTQS